MPRSKLIVPLLLQCPTSIAHCIYHRHCIQAPGCKATHHLSRFCIVNFTMRIQDPLNVRIVTKNIRYATKSPGQGEEPWHVRLPHLVNELRFSTLYCRESLICLQEALYEQIQDILTALNEDDDWNFIGVGRDNGYKLGEFSPILYRRSAWEPERIETVWLSETPKQPSRGWDAACNRVLTIANLSHRGSRQKILALNTHLDHKGHIARQQSAKIILQQIERHGWLDAETRLPTFLAGDFNSEPDQEAYLAITGSLSPMRDLRNIVTKEQRYGDINTFSGFDDVSRRKRIDFLFIDQGTYSRKSWLATGYTVLPNRFEDRIYNSDHQAVVGDVRLR